MILARLDKFPPCLCRLVARKANGHQPLSCADLASKSNLSKSYVASLSIKTTWAGVSVEVADSFSRACGVDLLRPHVSLEYLRSSKMQATKNATKAQRRFLLKLFSIASKK